ncbi:uncharacterized protein LOC113464053, partial [Ceratina calcarata]|uniref:Uncharacterized protein LOC113464053 n=1 Tax=Ceratina calcarata TaxID=156304 RepID=A0AAJ7W934_9HYME
MEAILTKNDLWCYVDRSKPKPTDTGNNAEQIATWKSFDKKAKADIVLSLNASEICHVKNLETSMDAWNALERIYASKGPAKRARLLKKLLFTRLTDDAEVYFGPFTSFRNDRSETCDPSVGYHTRP